MADSRIRAHLVIDMDLCVGHARCSALAPDLVALDELGAPAVEPGGVDAAHLDAARLAVNNCPEGAIRLEPGGVPPNE